MKKTINRMILFIVMTVFLFSCQAMAAPVIHKLTVENGADITKELQAALNYSKNDESGTIHEIVIPAGTYTINSCLNMYSNTTISMYGATLKRGRNGLTMLRNGRQDLDPDGYDGYDGHTNLTFKGGTWNGNSFTGTLIRLGHTNNVVMEDVSFINVKNSHFVEIAATRDAIVTGCTFKDFVGDFKTATNREALQLDIINGNHFEGYPKFDETPNKNFLVENCTFDHLQRGLGSHSAVVGRYFDNINFKNNVFSNITGYAILTTNYINSEISGNKIINCGSGIIFRSMNRNRGNFFMPKVQKNYDLILDTKSLICDNEITVNYSGYPNMAVGISLYGEELKKTTNDIPAGDYSTEGVIVKNNKVTLNCKGEAICLQDANKNTINKNTIVCNITSKGTGEGTGDGIRLVSSDNNLISNNKISNKKTTGNASGMQGISILNGSNNNTIKSNTIQKCSTDGIRLKDSKENTIDSNTITSCVRTGLCVMENTSKITMTGNKITGSKEDGIRLKSTTGDIITSNVIKTSGRIGIAALEGTVKLTVKKNKISGSKEDGIRVKGSSGNTISSNTITTSKKVGISLLENTKKTTVSSNTITDSGEDGIRIKKANDITVKNNKIKNCGRIGLFVTDKSKVKESGDSISNVGLKNATYKNSLIKLSNGATINGKQTYK